MSYPDDADIEIPHGIAQAALDHAQQQDANRGDWPSPRTGVQQPNPPFPATDNPMLVLLLTRARAQLEAGRDIDTVLLHLAVHAWFEGHIEGYDRGRREAAALTR